MNKRLIACFAFILVTSAQAHHQWGTVVCYNEPDWKTCEASTTAAGGVELEYDWWNVSANFGYWEDISTDVNYNVYHCRPYGWDLNVNLHTAETSTSPTIFGHGCWYCDSPIPSI